LNEFIKLYSLSFLENLLPDVDIINKILDYFNENNHVYLDKIYDDLEIDFFSLKRTLIWLAKFGYIEIEGKKNEK